MNEFVIRPRLITGISAAAPPVRTSVLSARSFPFIARLFPAHIPTLASVFEVVTNGRVYCIEGARLERWILQRRHELKGPQGFSLPLATDVGMIGYAIISASPGSLTVPFFGKVTLSHVTRILQGQGTRHNSQRSQLLTFAPVIRAAPPVASEMCGEPPGQQES